MLCQQLGIQQNPSYADLEGRHLQSDSWQEWPAIARGIIWLQLQQAIAQATKQGWQQNCTVEEQLPPEPLLAIVRDKMMGLDAYLESCVNEDFTSGAGPCISVVGYACSFAKLLVMLQAQMLCSAAMLDALHENEMRAQFFLNISWSASLIELIKACKTCCPLYALEQARSIDAAHHTCRAHNGL